MAPLDSITIRYPASFFLASTSPSVLLSGGTTANVTLHSQSFVVLTLNSGGFAALTSAAITFTGLTLGDATADVASSMSIITSKVAVIVASLHEYFCFFGVSLVAPGRERRSHHFGQRAYRQQRVAVIFLHCSQRPRCRKKRCRSDLCIYALFRRTTC